MGEIINKKRPSNVINLYNKVNSPISNASRLCVLEVLASALSNLFMATHACGVCSRENKLTRNPSVYHRGL